MTKIKKDRFGLYVTCGGYIARPTPCRWDRHFPTVMNTSFKEGDEVKAHHTGGSTRATIKSETLKETWATQSIMNSTYVKCKKNLSPEEFDIVLEYYSDYTNQPNYHDSSFLAQSDLVKQLVEKANVR